MCAKLNVLQFIFHQWIFCFFSSNSLPFASQEEEEDAQGVWGQEPPRECLRGSSEPGSHLLCCSTLTTVISRFYLFRYVIWIMPRYQPDVCMFLFLHLPKMQCFRPDVCQGRATVDSRLRGKGLLCFTNLSKCLILVLFWCLLSPTCRAFSFSSASRASCSLLRFASSTW